jgi:hypothetical protein
MGYDYNEESYLHMWLLLVEVLEGEGDSLHGLVVGSNEIASKVHSVYILNTSLEVSYLGYVVSYHLQ